MDTCNYVGCNNTSENSAMFPYPVDDWKRLNLWLLHSGNSLDFHNKYICSAHFHPSKLRKDTFGVIGLTEGAVPQDYLHRGSGDSDEEKDFQLKKPAKVYPKTKTVNVKSYAKKGNLIQRDTNINTGINLNIHLTQSTHKEKEEVSVYTIAANGVLTDSKNDSNKNTDKQILAIPESSTEIKVKIEPEVLPELNVNEIDNAEDMAKTVKQEASTDLQIKLESLDVDDIKLEKDTEPDNLEVELDIPFKSERSSTDEERIHFEEVDIKIEQSTDDAEILDVDKETNARSNVVVDIKREWNECSDPEVECGDPGVECSSESIECDSAVVGCTSDTLNTDMNAPMFYDEVTEQWCCGACDVKYHYKYDLQRHRVARHGAPKYPKRIFKVAPDEPERCAICNSQFQHHSDLQKHMESRHRSTTKPFQCDVCFERYKYEFMLIAHKKEHRTANDHTMAGQTDDPMDFTDLLIPLRSNVFTEAQDAPKSSAQRQREYRQRIAASKTPAQAIAARVSETERKRNYRLRKAANLALASGSLESTTASSSSAGRSNDIQNSTQRHLTNHRRQTSAEPAQTTVQPETSSVKIEVPDEPMDFTDLPLPLRSNPSVETQDAAASSVTSFAEPPTIAAPKSSAQRQREYRQRMAASKTPRQTTAARISDTERKRNYRLRKAANLALGSGSLESATASSSHQQRQSLAAEPAQITVQPDTSDQIEVQAQFADPATITAPKSKAQKQREYRQRIAASKTPAQVIAARKLNLERQRNCRLRKAAKSALVSGSLELTTVSSRSGGRSNDVQTGSQRQLTNQRQITVQPGTSSDEIEVQQAQASWKTKWASSIMRFESTFLDNDFGYACSVCDRLWFKKDLKPITAAQMEVISEWFVKENRRMCREEYKMVCGTCKRLLNRKMMPALAKVNGFSYPDQPPGLPPLDPISERLISPRLPFMQVRRLRHDFSCGIIGQVINVPVDVQEMVKCLPRLLNEDDVINVNIERNLAHDSVYISGYMSKSTISAWLTLLQESPLYRLYEIDVDLSKLHPTMPFLDKIQDDPSNRIENIAENTRESEILASRQHTMMWNEEDCLNIAPGHQATPLNTIYDRHAEELSFPSIYFGEPRRFNTGVPVTPYMIAASEIRRRDRRGATPQKILYVAMKILRMRMVNGIYSTFRNVSVTKDVTRRMLEDTEFIKEYGILNLAFMKTVPNSVQYWASRKRDLFALIRQLGKPTVFLTISANEIRWMKLLTILLKLSNKYPGKTAKDLNNSERCSLVSDDPVTCCIYFYKLVGSLLKMLKSKQSYNPFGEYSVKDYFLRIEFQHQGSHAHILLWLNDDPRETVSENMPRTIELVEKLSSVARGDVPNDSVYANQIHKHTLACTKGETTCRFGIPYWPMLTTRVLIPIPQSDGRLQTLQQKAKELLTSLGERRYAYMDDFLNANGLTYDSYLDIVRSTLRRPTLVFRRNFDELMTNTFNPYLAGEVNSNIDIQFILDVHSCAEYIVEYVSKTARGMSGLRRELTRMMQDPERDFTGQLKALSIKLLDSVEMSAQEAAWYLLRQPMSETSRHVVYIPTVWPTERQCCRKLRKQMNREGIDEDSTDVWTKNIIQRYEERPASLEQVYLAEFASWYANLNDFADEDDVHVDDDYDSEVPEARTSRAPKEYRRRPLGRVIRYRHYDIDDTDNYKREMVLLYVQFRSEMSEIVGQNKFLQLFDDNKDTIMERRSLFETNLNIENVTKELEAMILQNDDNSNL